MKNIAYTERNGIYYPNLELPTQTNYSLGKYANLRLDFMKKHRRGTYTTLLTEGRLNEYLHAIDIQAHELLDDIISRLAQERGIDETLKAHDTLQWHGNIIPQEDSRTNSKEMKELLGYMSRHHEDLEKSFSEEQKEIFEKFHDCWSEYMSLGEAAIFEYAFKLGMQIAIETLTE